ncbi:MAG: alpha,alpha-phosphotrehalase [Tissierellia bacterium]|nr:alpha,alpha-phosphotrehalase [Tissierellia bacterium]
MKSLEKMVIYQIYPKSFQDSNDDGIGDIRGIIQHIDYFVELGIDMIWMNPIFVSPQKDNGYDITHYTKIDPIFGTMEDLEELIEKLEIHDIGLMFDMVFNHSSTTHPWFQQALAGNKKYEDFYIIRPPKDSGDLPTNWASKFGGPAWAPFGDSGKYYLHLYDPSQADLNWRNENMRNELYDIVDFWMDKGIKGFRFDVLNVIGKDEILVDSTGSIDQEKSLYTDTPVVHDYIREMNRKTFGHREITTVGEMSSTNIQNSIEYTKKENDQLDMIFSFHHLKVDYKDGDKWTLMDFDFLKLKEILFQWQLGMEKGNGWMALFWNNHDQPRSNHRFGDTKNYPYEVATMLAHCLHMMRGTPYIYQGEEFGMVGPHFKTITDYRDVESKNAYERLIKDHRHEEAMAIIAAKSRDDSRTPMQWDHGEKYYGFSKEKPWIMPADDGISLKRDRKNKNSIFQFYKDLIAIRKSEPIIQSGKIKPILVDHPRIFGYIRSNGEDEIIVLNNFYPEPVEIQWDLPSDEKIIGNGPLKKLTDTICLEPYECGSWKI